MILNLFQVQFSYRKAIFETSSRSCRSGNGEESPGNTERQALESKGWGNLTDSATENYRLSR